MDLNARIFVAGHNGLVGSAILKTLKAKGYTNLIAKNRAALNLMDYGAVNAFFKKEHPEFIFLAVAKVGGILDNNTRRGTFIYENLMIQNHVLPALIRKIYLAKLYQESDFKGLLADLKVSDLAEAQRVLENYGITKTSAEIWGRGKPLREFLWSEDMAEACVFVMKVVNFEACIFKF